MSSLTEVSSSRVQPTLTASTWNTHPKQTQGMQRRKNSDYQNTKHPNLKEAHCTAPSHPGMHTQLSVLAISSNRKQNYRNISSPSMQQKCRTNLITTSAFQHHHFSKIFLWESMKSSFYNNNKTKTFAHFWQRQWAVLHVPAAHPQVSEDKPSGEWR